MIAHYIGRCPTCKAAYRVTRAYVDANGYPHCCTRCGTWHRRCHPNVYNNIYAGNVMDYRTRLVWKPIQGFLSPDHKCDARCTGAVGHICECSCGGANHGADHSC